MVRALLVAALTALVACASSTPRVEAPAPTAMPAESAPVAPSSAPSPALEPEPPASSAPPAPPSAQVALLRGELRKALAVARKRQIARLRAYREAGRFPVRKLGFGDRLAHRLTWEPLFVDASDVPCAVAYLMRAAGWSSEVTAIATKTPDVRIEEVTQGPILEWVLRSGLTQDEATLIQPDYKLWIARSKRTLARDRERLVAHFRAVERQLLANTEVSLDIATVRLLPTMLAGGALGELDDRKPASPSTGSPDA